MMNQTKNSIPIEGNLVRLKDRMQTMTRQEERRLRWTLGIKCFILLFITVYMGWVYMSLRHVDADFFVNAGRHKFYAALPELKAAMKARLTQMAPDVVNQAGHQFLRSIPRMEDRLQASGKEAMVKLSEAVERDLGAWISNILQRSKLEMDEMFPGMSSYEKLTRYRQYLLKNFSGGIELIIQRLHHFLGRKDLTIREELEQDILGIWYLILQEQVSNLKIADLKALS